LWKLSLCSVHPLCLDWIKQFLANRIQRVKVNSTLSNPVNCTSGTPQGSVISSILFIIYMNDLPSVINHANICLYADDVKLYLPITSPLDSTNLQSDINNLASWCKTWSLRLNLKKCAALDIGPPIFNPFPCNYTLDDLQIATDTGYKDLGVLTSNSLNFNSHHHRIINSAHSRANLILRAFPYSDNQTLCKLFCTYVRPLLEYCSPIWSPHTLENIDLIENVQRSFTRRLHGISSLTYPDRLTATNLPSLEIRRLRNDCVLLYNILHNNLYFPHNMFTFRSDVVTSNINTRGHNQRLFIEHINSDTVKYAFFHRTSMI